MNQKRLVREVITINKKLVEVKELHDKKEMTDSQFNQAKQNLEEDKAKYESQLAELKEKEKKEKKDKKEKEKREKEAKEKEAKEEGEITEENKESKDSKEKGGPAFMNYLKKYKKNKDDPTAPAPVLDGPEEKDEPEENDDAEDEPQYKRQTPQEEFASLIHEYYKLEPYITTNGSPYKELEVRFGTRGIKPLTKTDYDNVILKLKSLGFRCENEDGMHSLRIQKEVLDESGRFQMSNIRTEINSIEGISKYCKTNSLTSIYSITYTKKSFAKTEKEQTIRSVNMDDWNFRVSLQNEVQLQNSRYINKDWSSSKKTFRYINRVTFAHPDYPVNVDISIVKNSTKNGRDFIKTVTVQDSGVFANPEIYEIELEIQNANIGPGTPFNTSASVLQMLKTVIKWVLSGLQGTNYPISYKEQRDVMKLYMRLLFQENYNERQRINNGDFIGPSPVTLHMANISEINENTTIPNIRVNYTVTEKADGMRNLLFIASTGKIYLINSNMQVMFTGVSSTNKATLNTLLDGELIQYDKNGKFIQLYAAFDLYYHNGKDVRHWGFIQKSKEDRARLTLLQNVIKTLTLDLSTSIIRIECKQFYVSRQDKQSIFEGCNKILTREKDNLFEYITDGLIFTPAYLGVGSDSVGKSGPLKKITWEHAFKWKPPQYNTIDFMVSIVRNASGKDIVTTMFESGNNIKLPEYKQLRLLCTFVPKKHGYINPCQDVIDDNLPEYNNKEEESQDYKAVPRQFYPTNPSDPMAGIANVLLKPDDNYAFQLFSEENELIEDNTIVEFKYDMEREAGWRWIPLRVRYDKTTELRQGIPNYGNAYHVANSNWQSINNPITEHMMNTGQDIADVSVSDDVYYNRDPSSRDSKTKALRDFHNLYVKKKLITGVSKTKDTLIDFSCGKAGDLSKWIDSHLSFVFGVDLSKDNLENNLDGACARLLNYRKKYRKVPDALFVNGNSANNIASGDAMLNDKAKEIAMAVFGKGQYSEEKLGKGVYKQFGKGVDGFNVASCQFSLHYFLQNIHTFRGFLKNLVECTKITGHFIATTYDGQTIFNLLKNKKMDESAQIVDDGKKIWEIVKKYDDSTLQDNSSCIGYKIDVYQETINQYIPEYLVNFTYFNRIMEDYGFTLVSKDEAEKMGFSSGGTGMFEQLYRNMVGEIKRNRIKESDCGTALQMNVSQQNISFLNRYYIYKKIRNVNPDKVEIDLSDYNFKRGEEPVAPVASDVPAPATTPTSKKIRRLNKKIVLQPATEALEDDADEMREQVTLTRAKEAAKEEPVKEAAKEEPVKEAAKEEVKEAVKEEVKEAKPKKTTKPRAKKEKEDKDEKEAKAEEKKEKEEKKEAKAEEKKEKEEKKEAKEEKTKEKKKPVFRYIPPAEGEEEIDYALVKTNKTLKNKKAKAESVTETQPKAAAEAEPGEKKKRCPNGSRKNKKGDCEKKPA